MVWLGIICGLICAWVTSLAYVFSRRFVVSQHAGVVKMLVLSHALMGVMAAACMPLLAFGPMPPLSAWFMPMFWASASYLIGQIGMLVALRRMDSSRVTPLLGLKVFMVALIAWAWSGKQLDTLQWAAVVLSVGATFMLNRAGGPMPMSTLAAMLFACFMYAISDVSIGALNDTMRPVGGLRAVVFGALACYALCGAVSALLLPWYGSREKGPWIAAMPYAVLWLIGIAFLFLCFSLSDVVLGNIVISSRAITAIVIGMVIAKMGHHHLEQSAAGSVWLRRGIAATAMVVAITIFALSDRIYDALQ